MSVVHFGVKLVTIQISHHHTNSDMHIVQEWVFQIDA